MFLSRIKKGQSNGQLKHWEAIPPQGPVLMPDGFEYAVRMPVRAVNPNGSGDLRHECVHCARVYLDYNAALVHVITYHLGFNMAEIRAGTSLYDLYKAARRWRD